MVLGGTLSDGDLAELTDIGQDKLQDGWHVNLHDVAAHMCRRAQQKQRPAQKQPRNTQAGPRDSKISKAQKSEDVPAASTRARSTARASGKSTPINSCAPSTDPALAERSSSAAPAPRISSPAERFAEHGIAMQRRDAAQQAEYLQQQLKEADAAMAAMAARNKPEGDMAAGQQLP